jgi:hypothetical protein
LIFLFWELFNDIYIYIIKDLPLCTSICSKYSTRFTIPNSQSDNSSLEAWKFLPFHFPNIFGLFLALVGYWLVSILPCVSYISYILVGTRDLRTLWHMTSFSLLLTILRTLYITKQHNSKCLFLKKGVICKSKFK